MEEISYKILLPDPYENAYECVMEEMRKRLDSREMEGIEAALNEHGFVKERTTRMKRDEFGVWVCDMCACGAAPEYGKSGQLDSWCDSWAPSFCPQCGAKVVG